ncbi:hypothetical protein TNCV_1234171, partial [Trichonephila clavipes]
LKTSDFRNKKWYGKKKKRASDPQKNIALNAEKNAVFTAERYYDFAEEAILFTVNVRSILMERKKRENRESPVMKDVTAFHQKNKRKKSSSPESLPGSSGSVYSASTPQVWGSINGLRKVDSAFHPRYIGSINEYQACFGS